MKKVLYLLIVIFLIIFSLVFDWGRRGENISNIKKGQNIFIDNIKEGQKISSPLEIKGRAKGNWFFEGSFPIKLIDTDNNILSVGLATSSENWMTEDYISFVSEISFVKPTSTKNAILIFEKDNPSGDPKFDEKILFPVILK